jgi:hypothetical protein
MIKGYPATRWMNFTGRVGSAGEIGKKYAILVA